MWKDHTTLDDLKARLLVDEIILVENFLRSGRIIKIIEVCHELIPRISTAQSVASFDCVLSAVKGG